MMWYGNVLTNHRVAVLESCEPRSTKMHTTTQFSSDQTHDKRAAVNPMSSAKSHSNNVVTIRYTNYRGETADRQIVPIRIRFGSSEWHPEEQWLLDAFDLDRNADRSFALKDVLQWRSDKNVSGRPRHQASAS